MTLNRTGALAVVVIAALSAPPSVLANGDDFFLAHPELLGPLQVTPYFGFVKDDRGAGVPDAKVIIRVKGTNLEYVATSGVIGGIYRSDHVSMDVDLKLIELSVSKPGYVEVGKVSRTRDPKVGNPIQVDFILKQQ